jgi:hypothetical protein
MNFSSTVAEYCDISNESNIQFLSICYPYFISNAIFLKSLEITLVILIGFFNILLFKTIYDKQKEKLVFDKILMTIAIVDVFCSFDLTFYHIFTTLRKWPFGKTFCVIWNLFNTSLNTISVFHMLFFTWTILMSVSQPKTYQNNKLIKHPFRVSLIFWLVNFLIWIPVNVGYITSDYKTGQCQINYRPYYIEFFLEFILWFMPLILNAGMLLYFIKVLNEKQRIIVPAKRFSSTINVQQPQQSDQLKLSPSTKLSIIVIVYLLQWLPSCLISMIDSLCKCIPYDVSQATHRLTFTTALTNPISVLVLLNFYNRKRKKSTIIRDITISKF